MPGHRQSNASGQGARPAEARNYARTDVLTLSSATARSVLIAFHKPYGVLSQFTSDGSKKTLAEYIDVPEVYAAGRLDFDSEGLLLLTNDGRMQHSIADPGRGLVKRYLAQIEGMPDDVTLARLADGITIGEGKSAFRAAPAKAVRIAEPLLPARTPPIRYRASIRTSWIEVALSEGKNRQVRRMTAAIGHPTLRLVRRAIGPLDLFELELEPGEWTIVDADRLGVASVR